MGMSKAKLYRETLEAAFELHRLRLWEEFENEDCFAVAVPGEEHPLVACILGQSGIEYGLNLVRGPRAATAMREMFSPDVSEREAFDHVPILGFTMMRLAEIPPERRKFLEKARFEGTRESLVPFFMAREPGRRPRDPTPEEAGKLLYVLRAIPKARSAGLLEPRSILDDGDVTTLVVSGDPLDPGVTAEFRTLADGPATVPGFLASPPPGFEKLPRLDARWFVAFPVIPGQIRGDDRTIRGVLVADGATGRIVAIKPVPGSDIGKAAQMLFEAFTGENPDKVRGLPGELVFTSRALFDAAAPALAGLGVETFYDPHVPEMDEIVAHMQEHFAGPADGEVPAPDDLARWKAVDRRFIERAVDLMRALKVNMRRAALRYFGSDDSSFGFIAPEQREFAIQCFQEWVIHDYRPTKRSRTVAEKMLVKAQALRLGGRLPEAERRVLKARIAAHPSIYKVEKIDRGLSLTFSDVLLGGTVEVFDKMMSRSGQEGTCLPMRVFQAGEFHFASPVGPPMSMFETTHAIEFLAREGLKLTPKDLVAGAHLFGHLWEFLEERRSAGPPRMVNFDGEDLVFHTATYRVMDEKAARDALAARPDVEQDEDDGNEYTLSGPPLRPQPGMETVTLGRLLFVGDEFLLKVNSAGRLERARRWLDSTPGLEFEKVSSRPLDQALAEGVPMDDRLGRSRLEMTPELEAWIREDLRRQYFDWLDARAWRLTSAASCGRTIRWTCLCLSRRCCASWGSTRVEAGQGCRARPEDREGEADGEAEVDGEVRALRLEVRVVGDVETSQVMQVEGGDARGQEAREALPRRGRGGRLPGVLDASRGAGGRNAR